MRLQGPVGQGRTAVSTRVPQWVSLVTTHSCPSGRYDPDHVCNASDTAGRYSYSKQPEVCKWNLQKLALLYSASQQGLILPPHFLGTPLPTCSE